jgi:two-component system, sensor histidine kinase and response regulator
MLPQAEFERLRRFGLQILVVDDDPVIRELLTEICRTIGVEVFSAGDGQAAWEVFQSTQIHLVITDVYMPRLNGIELLVRIKDYNPACAVILITGYGHYQQVVYKQQIKPDAFILKPFSFNDIIKEILLLANHAIDHLTEPDQIQS